MSFLDNARRALSGKTDDYEDDREYDEEYEDYEEEKPRKGLFSFLSRNKTDEYEDYEEEEEAADRRSSIRNSSSYSSSARAAAPSSRDKYGAKPQLKYVPNLSGVEVTVLYPVSFDDSAKLVKEVKEGKITLFDVSGIETTEEARRVVDYICGAAEGMECPFSRLCPSIFCIAPKGVVLTNRKSRF